MSELPDGWVEAIGEDTFEIIRGVSYKKGDARSEASDGLIPILRATNIQDSQIILDDLVYVPASYVSPQQFLKRGDILIATSSGSRDVVGKAVQFIDADAPLAFGAFCAVARPRLENLSNYLSYYTRSRAYRKYVEEVALGININNFRTSDLSALPLYLPPEAEQRRIVGKLDALFARTRRAREKLSHIPRLIENYKKAILEAAFRGELTKDWEIVDFSKLLSSAQNGLSKRSGTKGRHMNVLRLSDLSDGRFVGDNPRSILLDEKEINKYCLKKRDLICVRVNGSEHLVGRMLVWSECEDWAFCDHFIRFQLKDDIADTAFVSWYFATDHVRRMIETTFVSSAGQKTVSQRILGEIEVPLPDIKTQRETVRRIERAMECLRVVDLEQAQAVHLLGHLDQANLSKAFRGELVPQDPNDEPAFVLLERIRALQKSAHKKGRTRQHKEAMA